MFRDKRKFFNLVFSFFFEIFSNQKIEYGINYREINKLLISKKIYEKDYFEYKKIVDN
jgi:hypothetical protein